MTANKCQKEKILTLKEAIQKDGQRHLCVKSAITSGTTQYEYELARNLAMLENLILGFICNP